MSHISLSHTSSPGFYAIKSNSQRKKFAIFLDMENQNQSNTNYSLKKRNNNPWFELATFHAKETYDSLFSCIPLHCTLTKHMSEAQNIMLPVFPLTVPGGCSGCAWHVSCSDGYTQMVWLRVFMQDWITCSKWILPLHTRISPKGLQCANRS